MQTGGNAGTTALDGVSSLRSYLTYDSRPSIVLDRHHISIAGSSTTCFAKAVVFTNPAFDADASLSSTILQGGKTAALEKDAVLFRQWVGATQETPAETQKVLFGICWTRTTLESRWCVLSGCRHVGANVQEQAYLAVTENEYGPGTLETLELQQNLLTGPYGSIPHPIPTFSVLDWTTPLPTPNLTNHQLLARSVDWDNTYLGSIASWDEVLRRSANFLMADPRPASLLWGPKHVLLYNEPYVEILSTKHPNAFGQSFEDVFTELPAFYEHFASVEKTHQAVTASDAQFSLIRDGLLEETYFSWSLIPIFSEGRVVGIYNPVFESTRSSIGERRMALLIRVGEMTAGQEDLKRFWDRLIKALTYSEIDTPFVAIYEAEDMLSSGSSQSSNSYPRSSRTISLREVIGLPKDDARLTALFDLTPDNSILQNHLYDVAESHKIKVLDADQLLRDSSTSRIEGIPCRPHGDLCRKLVILPIKPTTRENVTGFVLLGLNPRRPYDPDHQVFVRLLNRLIDSSMAATMLLEEEMKRSQTAAKRAALEHARLQEELLISNRQFKRSEVKFRAFASRAPIGMVQLNPEGDILFANEAWYGFTQIKPDTQQPKAWLGCVLEEDIKGVEARFADVTAKASLTFDIRLKRDWTLSDHSVLSTRDERHPWIWVSVSWYSVLDEEGEIESIMSTIMDITTQKLSEELQQKRVEDALEAKRLQESFIDMTSHEMRNPLSAIIHCCDGIIQSLSGESDTTLSGRHISDEALKDSLDAVRTILHCSQHQKRIVDDVLNLSRLDSGLLPISPVNTPLLQTITKTISMFTTELRAADIHFGFEVEDSFRQLDVQRVFVDPSRMSQIFINLLANAIKFTQSASIRRIHVRVGASRERPVTFPGSEVRFFEAESFTVGPEWGDGEQLYLQFAIQDTGRGLSQTEMDSLFQKFKQANPRTYIKYGGSGLGLYISKVLCEKQGGAIGVYSEREKGSTFAFYLLAKRAPDIDSEPHSQLLHVSSADELVALHKEQLNSGASEYSEVRVVESAASLPIRSTTSDGRFPVLIVEDNLVNRRVLAKQLRKTCHPIFEANHGVEALSLLKETDIWQGNVNSGTSPEAILMDVEMPIMDGLACTRQIRALESDGTITRHIPIIAVTANARKEQVDACLGAGMDDVVCKPFRIPELVARMQALGVGIGAAKEPSVANGT